MTDSNDERLPTRIGVVGRHGRSSHEPDWDDSQLQEALLAAVEGPHHVLSFEALHELVEQSIARAKAAAG
jgi:hypothetical protein